MEAKYDKKFEELRVQLNTKHEWVCCFKVKFVLIVDLSMEIAEVEERKNNQITELKKHNDKAFNEMKNYYNDITLNNLALISSLKVALQIYIKKKRYIINVINYLQMVNY